MTSKEEALFTHERIINLSGSAAQCQHCTSLVVQKLAEQDEVALFLNKGTTYSSPLGTSLGLPVGAAGSSPSHRKQGGGHQHHGNGRAGSSRSSAASSSAAEVVSDTTITLAVPDELIGNILGKQGATMREIISLSGANVVVSKRGDYVEGTTNRLVTITGPPTCAQTAHLFITQRLHVSAKYTLSTPHPTCGHDVLIYIYEYIDSIEPSSPHQQKVNVSRLVVCVYANFDRLCVCNI
jgi:RNA-binding protein Nova